MAENVARLQAVLERNGLQGAVAFSPENVAWMAEFMIPSHPIIRRRHAAALVTRSNSCLLVADMEETTARQASAIQEILPYREFRDEPMQVLARGVRAGGAGRGRLGVEMNYLPAADFKCLADALPGVDLVPCDDILTELRMVKTERELVCLRKIAKIAEEVHRELVKEARPGRTERDLARKLLDETIARGGERMRLMVIGSGPRSILPNAPFTDRQLKEGDTVRVDIIASADHFHSDIARTFTVGRPSERQREMWRRLVDTERAILARVKPGARTAALYAAFRTKYEEYGLPLSTFVGHGIGLDLHERPYVSGLDDVELKEGMVLCIEPFYFGPDEGFHIEDEVVVTKEGCEFLTHGHESEDIAFSSW